MVYSSYNSLTFPSEFWERSLVSQEEKKGEEALYRIHHPRLEGRLES